MKKITYILFLLLFVSNNVFAQEPVVIEVPDLGPQALFEKLNETGKEKQNGPIKSTVKKETTRP